MDDDRVEHRDYKILSTSWYPDLEKEVTDFLGRGYALAGGLNVVKDTVFDSTYYYQSVVK